MEIFCIKGKIVGQIETDDLCFRIELTKDELTSFHQVNLNISNKLLHNLKFQKRMLQIMKVKLKEIINA